MCVWGPQASWRPFLLPLMITSCHLYFFLLDHCQNCRCLDADQSAEQKGFHGDVQMSVLYQPSFLCGLCCITLSQPLSSCIRGTCGSGRVVIQLVVGAFVPGPSFSSPQSFLEQETESTMGVRVCVCVDR